MEIKEYEQFVRNEINKVVVKIIENKTKLNIRAKSRAGAEISNYLEEEFEKWAEIYSEYLKKPLKSPKKSTKNPWDAKVEFVYKKVVEEIWIDFKSIKIDQLDSNPDMGSANKVVNFIKKGNFYLLYVIVFYEEKDFGLEFSKINGKYTKSYFLKDVNKSFRRTPTNQLQVGISVEPEYRTRTEFIQLLPKKLEESYLRQINKAKKELVKLEEIKKELFLANSKSEKNIKERIKKD